MNNQDEEIIRLPYYPIKKEEEIIRLPYIPISKEQQKSNTMIVSHIGNEPERNVVEPNEEQTKNLYGEIENLLRDVADENQAQGVKKQMSFITIDQENSKIIGSLSYAIQKYPGDIDVLEEVSGCCSQDEIITNFINGINKIVDNYTNKEFRWFIELKAGRDTRYDFDYMGGSAERIWKRIKGLAKYELLTPKDTKKILEILNNAKKITKDTQIDICQRTELSKFMREFAVLRWNAEEIKQGYKILPAYGDEKYTLREALKQTGEVNIEAIAVVGPYITDVSNYFVLTYHNQNDPSKIYAINLPQESITDFNSFTIGSLMNSIYKLSDPCTPMSNQYFKAYKRMWSLCRFLIPKLYGKDLNLFNMYTNYLRKLAPIISGDISFLNQIKARLTGIYKVIKYELYPFPLKVILNELNLIKSDITRLISFQRNIIDVTEITIDDVIKILEERPFNLKNKRETLIEQLSKLISVIEYDINSYSLEYGIDNGLMIGVLDEDGAQTFATINKQDYAIFVPPELFTLAVTDKQAFDDLINVINN